MPKRTDIHRVLVIGSGPIVIGQGCEFDYSGTQAIELIGASIEAINVAEDRQQFRDAMKEISIEVPASRVAKSLESGLAVLEEVGFPAIIRPSFTLGGVGGGIAYNLEEFKEITKYL